MSAEIKDLSPKHVWGYFYDLTQIPRPTGHCSLIWIWFPKKTLP